MAYKVKPFLTIILTAILLVVAAVWSLYRYQNFRSEQTQQLLLLQSLNAGAELLTAEASQLLQDDAVLNKVQKQHDLNIIHYQTVSQGSLKQGLSPLESMTNYDLQELTSGFSAFSEAAANLIQNRANLTKLVENRETVVLASRSLADKSADLALGLRQINAPAEQIAEAYNLALALNNHYLSVIRAFDAQSAYVAPDLKLARQTLEALSTGKSAPASTIIKRSAANLLSEIEAFSSYTQSIARHHELKLSIQNQLELLAQTATQLASAVDAVSEDLTSAGSMYLIVSLIAWVLALGSTVTGAAYRSSLRPKQPEANPYPKPQPASEITSSHYLNQLKTDKNKLMSDIRPLGEGILYIRADEHLESTGDLAKCFNQSREALIQKIESLQATVSSLQACINQPDAEDKPTSDRHYLSIDTTPVENLTFKAQAELEGLQRKIRGLEWSDKEAAKTLLIHCLRADRMLDEVRVRVKKGWQEMIQESQESAHSHSQSEQASAIKLLVDEMKSNLDEFQTQAPKPRRRQAV